MSIGMAKTSQSNRQGQLKKKINLRHFLERLNTLPIFTPDLWPKREFISRVTAIMIVCCFLFLKIYNFDRFPQTFDSINSFYLSVNKRFSEILFTSSDIYLLWVTRLLTWIIETAILMGYILSYLIRTRAINVARGFMETVFPFIIAGIPILISFAPYNLPLRVPYDANHYIQNYIGVTGLILTGGAVNLIGLITLRRAFAIMSEARLLVTSGIYKYLRHPLYTGHFIMFFGSLWMRLHHYTIAMYAVFVIGQYLRARIEEKKLADTFPEYAGFKKRTGMFLPRIFSK